MGFHSQFLEIANNGNIVAKNKKEKKPIISFCQNGYYICEHFGYTAFIHRGYYGQETKIIIVIRECGNWGGRGISGS